MYWTTGVALLQSALMTALWLSLPLLAAIAVAGWAGGYLQGLLGLSDQSGLVAPKLILAAVVFALFSPWMLSLTLSYWGPLWAGAATLVQGR